MQDDAARVAAAAQAAKEQDDQVKTVRKVVTRVLANLVLGTSFGTLAPLLLLLSAVMAPLLIIGINLEELINQHKVDHQKERRLMMIKNMGNNVAVSIRVLIPNKGIGQIMVALLCVTELGILWSFGFAIGSWIGFAAMIVLHWIYIAYRPDAEIQNQAAAKAPRSEIHFRARRRIALDVPSNISISELRNEIATKLGDDMGAMTLKCGDVVLSGMGQTLRDHVSWTGETLHLDHNTCPHCSRSNTTLYTTLVQDIPQMHVHGSGSNGDGHGLEVEMKETSLGRHGQVMNGDKSLQNAASHAMLSSTAVVTDRIQIECNPVMDGILQTNDMF